MASKLFFAFFLVFLFCGFGFASTTSNVLYDWSWQGVSVDACDVSNEEAVFCDAAQFSISLLKKLDSVSAGSSFEFDAFLMGDGFSRDFRSDFDYYYSNISFFDSPSFYINEQDGLRHYFADFDLFVFKLNGEAWVDGAKLVPGEYRVSVDVPIDFNPGVLGFEPVVVDFEFLSSPDEESALLFLPFDGEIGFFRGDKDRSGYGVVFSSGGELSLNDKVIFDSAVSGGIVEVSDFIFVDDFVELNDFYKKKQLLKIVDEGDFSFVAEELGSYEALITADLNGHKPIVITKKFAVIEKQPNFRNASQCNGNGVCDFGENEKNCPQDCLGETQFDFSIILVAGFGFLVLFGISLFIFKKKLNLKN